MARPELLLPSDPQPAGMVPILFQIPNCKAAHTLKLYKINGNKKTAAVRILPTLEEFGEVLPMKRSCFYDNQKDPTVGTASAVANFAEADIGDYLLEICEDGGMCYYAGIITIVASTKARKKRARSKAKK